MKLTGLVFFSAAAGLTQALVPKMSGPKTTASLNLVSVAAESITDAYQKPERVIRDEIPTLYVYDHCPFCVRVRVVLGIKNINHNLYFMANDDVKTPSDLVGKKIAPIFVSCSFSHSYCHLLLVFFVVVVYVHISSSLLYYCITTACRRRNNNNGNNSKELVVGCCCFAVIIIINNNYSIENFSA